MWAKLTRNTNFESREPGSDSMPGNQEGINTEVTLRMALFGFTHLPEWKYLKTEYVRLIKIQWVKSSGTILEKLQQTNKSKNTTNGSTQLSFHCVVPADRYLPF